MNIAPSTYSGGVLWRHQTTKIVASLRIALQNAIGFQRGVGRKSGDLQKQFGVAFALSWQIFRIVTESNALAAAPHIPPSAAMKRLVGCLREKGVAADLIAPLETAFDRFESHVTATAGSRDVFDVMTVQFLGGEVAEEVERTHREAAFNAHRFIGGVQQELGMSTAFLRPVSMGDYHVDTLRLHVRRGLMRLNLKNRIFVDKHGHTGDEEEILRLNRRPLDQEAFDHYGVHVLPQFCSRQELPLRGHKRLDGDIETEWASDEIGLASAVDIAFGHANMATPYIREDDGTRRLVHAGISSMPTKLSIFDLFVHRPTLQLKSARVTRWSKAVSPPNAPTIEELGLPELPCYEKLEFLGGGSAVVYNPDLPNYLDMLQYACKQMNWDLEEFDLYRARIEYPLIDTMTGYHLEFTSPRA